MKISHMYNWNTSGRGQRKGAIWRNSGWNFPQICETQIYISESQQAPSRLNITKTTHGQIIVKELKNREKENLDSSQFLFICTRTMMGITADFPLETVGARDSRATSLKCWVGRRKPVIPELYIQWRYS